jgi:Pretoxin HINT domain
VLLASGKAIPISSLRVGEMVLATNTKTGKTQPEAVAAVLVHHDTDLYDLKIRDRGKTSVIDTTSSHLFWIPGSTGGGRWAKAASLKYGTHLRTPDGSDTATVTGGWTPAVTTGWMWDLTIPGNNDHDFYIDTTVGSLLVHNNDEPMVGACGTQVTSRTLMQNKDFHIDVENPNPGVRAGQLHLQDYVGNKYQYNFGTGQFEGLPNSLAGKVANNPLVGRAIRTGLRYLGMGS